MPDSIYIFIFKVLRKLRQSWNKFMLRRRIASYHYLSHKRFIIDTSFNAGTNFSIATDLTETKINISANVQARKNFNIRMGHQGQLSIGRNCFFNNNCSINCLGNIEIGNDSQFGENVVMYDHNHQYADKNSLVSNQGYSIGKIKIGNNCWIGSNVVILKNITIGDNAVIGAGCVIYQSISPDTVVINHQNLVENPVNYK